MFGLGQPLADGLKFILKEDYRPRAWTRSCSPSRPAIMIIVVIISIAVLPWGGWKQATKTIDVTGQRRESHMPSSRSAQNSPRWTPSRRSTSPSQCHRREQPGKTFVDVTYR